MIVGLTGGIGTGKSTVARIFGTINVPVYYSDDRAKELYFEADIKKKVIALLGHEAYTESGELNRKFISKSVFSNAKLLNQINAIIHPAVEIDFKKFQEANNIHKYVVKETALLFEAGIYKKVDKIILVTAPLNIRLQRVKLRDNLSEEEIIKRINSQMPDEEKLPISDFSITNDEKYALIPQVLAIHEKLKNA